jgi:hypothetical protein
MLARPDFWILNAILALWMSTSRRFQRTSHICVLEGNLIASITLSGVQIGASWSSSKLLDIEEGLDGKISPSRRMMLWTVGRPDGISCRPDGCKGSDFFDL